MLRFVPTALLFTISLALLSSCEKAPEELDLIGTWKLEQVTKKRGAGTINTVITGYEPGEFLFNGDRTVVYTQGNRQLQGYFQLIQDNSGYYDERDVWQQTGLNCFQLTLNDTGGNQVVHWEFPDFALSEDRTFFYAYYRDNTGEFSYRFKRL